VPSADTPRIQEAHILAGHVLCEILEKEVNAGKVAAAPNGVGARNPLPSRPQ